MRARIQQKMIRFKIVVKYLKVDISQRMFSTSHKGGQDTKETAKTEKMILVLQTPNAKKTQPSKKGVLSETANLLITYAALI